MSPTLVWHTFAALQRRLDPTVDEAVAGVLAYRASVPPERWGWNPSGVEAVPMHWQDHPAVAAVLATIAGLEGL